MTDDLAFNGYDESQPGLGAQYPRMLYRAGHMANIHGYDVDYITVDNEGQENVLTAEGWALTPQRAHKPAPPPVPDTRDDQIAALTAQIAAMQSVQPADEEPSEPRRGPGRPPKPRDEAIAP